MQPASQQQPRSPHSSGLAPKHTTSSVAGQRGGSTLGGGPEGPALVVVVLEVVPVAAELVVVVRDGAEKSIFLKRNSEYFIDE